MHHELAGESAEFSLFFYGSYMAQTAEEKIIQGPRGPGVTCSRRNYWWQQYGIKMEKYFFDSLHCLRQEAVNQQQGCSSSSQNRSLQHRQDFIPAWSVQLWIPVIFLSMEWSTWSISGTEGSTYNSSNPIDREGTASLLFSFPPCSLSFWCLMIIHYWCRKKGRQA